MQTVHISDTEAASDFAGLLAKVRAGSEVIIEHGSTSVAIVRAPEPWLVDFMLFPRSTSGSVTEMCKVINAWQKIEKS